MARQQEVAAGVRDSFYEDATVAGTHVRILTKPLAPGIALQIARGLGAAHARDIVHRALKPDNIFISVDSTGLHVPKLLDFGIAKALLASHAVTVSAPRTELTTFSGSIVISKR